MAKERNQYVDIMRGVAMLLVVLGHTMTGCTLNSEKSILFNIIWSLQMPLFILISGYVTRYSRELSSFKDLGIFIKRRTISYVFPWVVWSIGIRGILFGETNFLDIRFMLWNMDSGYWFLATIWTINIIFGLSVFCAKKVIDKSGFKQQVVTAAIYGIGMFCLLGVGMIFGMSFFAIKLTLYYMPFYFAGYLYGQYEDKFNCMKKGKQYLDRVVAISFFVWVYAILRYSLYNMSDDGLAIIIRVLVSLSGCIAVLGLGNGIFGKYGWKTLMNGKSFTSNMSCSLSNARPDLDEKSTGILNNTRIDVNNSQLCSHIGNGGSDYKYNQHQNFAKNHVCKNVIGTFFYWFGKHSLEVYLIHGLFLNILKTKELQLFSSIIGYGLTFCNYLLTIMLCYVVITILRESDVLRKILCLR